MADLGDREDIDQIEEQLFLGDAGMVAVAGAERRLGHGIAGRVISIRGGGERVGAEKAPLPTLGSRLGAFASVDREALESQSGRGGLARFIWPAPGMTRGAVTGETEAAGSDLFRAD